MEWKNPFKSEEKNPLEDLLRVMNKLSDGKHAFFTISMEVDDEGAIVTKGTFNSANAGEHAKKLHQLSDKVAEAVHEALAKHSKGLKLGKLAMEGAEDEWPEEVDEGRTA